VGNLFLELLIKPKRKVSIVGLASVGVGVLVVVWEMFGVELQAVVKIKKQDAATKDNLGKEKLSIGINGREK
jgi:hypothetical protein